MIQIRQLSDKEIQEEQLKQFPEYNLFSSIGFCNLWECMGGKALFWTAFEGDKVIGVMPSVEFGIKKLKRIQSMPDGCYSNLLCNDDFQRDEIEKQIFNEILKAGYLKIFVNDYFHKYSSVKNYDRIKCNTTLVEIFPDWIPSDKKLVSEINKAERENVEIQEFVYEKHFDNFIYLMKSTEKRHGRKPKYPDIFFNKLASFSEKNNSVQWLVVEYENEIAASHINFIVQDTLLSWQIYFNKKFSFLKPNQFLLFRAARDAAKKGVTKLNLGASPDNADSLKYYKDKWGGVNYEYPCYVKKNWLGRLL
ncbi:MAG: hypothetical protein DRP35_07525 [Candidatus Zixiibacteriota bacterium]|nr:MAG: hypothetical protein DRP35_07525 [candidate division Zixibacteria bacterium]